MHYQYDVLLSHLTSHAFYKDCHYTQNCICRSLDWRVTINFADGNFEPKEVIIICGKIYSDIII